MNPDRLDDLVRQAQTLDATRAAALGDPQLRQRLLQEITTMDTSPQPHTPPARRTWRVVAVTAATLAGAAAAFVLIGLPGQGQSPPSAAPTTAASATVALQGDVFGDTASCVEQYSPQALRQRAFAFDGTVLAIGQTDPGKVETSPEVPITFQVHRWYRGGQGERVTVAMMPPSTITSTGDAGYGTGSRLLVSGEPRFGGRPLDDPIAWPCGFTRWHTAADAQTWQQALG